jgi:hypothetical protein
MQVNDDYAFDTEEEKCQSREAVLLGTGLAAIVGRVRTPRKWALLKKLSIFS